MPATHEVMYFHHHHLNISLIRNRKTRKFRVEVFNDLGKTLFRSRRYSSWPAAINKAKRFIDR